jgi:hypothetical protein
MVGTVCSQKIARIKKQSQQKATATTEVEELQDIDIYADMIIGSV